VKKSTALLLATYAALTGFHLGTWVMLWILSERPAQAVTDPHANDVWDVLAQANRITREASDGMG